MNTVTTTIDWISYTAQDLPEGIPYLFPDFVRDLTRTPSSPKFGYARAYTLEFGIVVMCEGTSERMGAHYIYSGSTLQRLLASGIEPTDVIKWHNERGHKPTRIDLAIDVYDEPNLMRDIHLAIDADQYEGSVKKISTTKSLVGTGETIYFGARTSPLFMRIYDKGAEQHVDKQWTRIEVECKDAKARTVEHLVLHSNQTPIYQTAATLAKTMFNCNWVSYQAALNAPNVTIGKPQANESDTEKWLMESVARTLARYSVNNPEKNILERFYTKVANEAIEISKGQGK